MGSLAVGSVVVVNFPFADFKHYKKRPAVVVAESSLNTVVLCQITSHQLPDVPGITIAAKDFKSGRLPLASYVRPDKLFTVDADIAKEDRIGVLAHRSTAAIRTAVRDLFA